MQFPTPSSILDAGTAEELLAFFRKYPVLDVAGFSLWQFETITPAAATAICTRGMDLLYLDSVKAVPPNVIRILCKSKVSLLSLGLRNVSPESAVVLSEFRGSILALNTLTTISAEVAQILARFPNLLSLNGIKILDVNVAKALTYHRASLVLDGLIYLPEEVAEILSCHQGTSLGLEGLPFLSDRAAKALQNYRGKLEMPQFEQNSSQYLRVNHSQPYC